MENITKNTYKETDFKIRENIYFSNLYYLLISLSFIFFHYDVEAVFQILNCSKSIYMCVLRVTFFQIV